MQNKRFNTEFELKNLSENGLFEGYASVFGVKDYDGDVIVKGAFSGSIKRMNETNKRPKMLFMHNVAVIVGKWLEMFEDEKGLYVKGQLFLDVDKGLELYKLMKHGELDAMSVGFNITNAERDGTTGRVIDDLELWEISLVTWGANPEALVSSVKCIDSERDFEKFLRDSGFSRADAKRITLHGYKSSETLEQNQRDAEQAEALKQLIISLKGTKQ